MTYTKYLLPYQHDVGERKNSVSVRNHTDRSRKSSWSRK